MACFMLVTFYSSAGAFDIQEGIHGMPWESSISGYSDLVRVKQLDKASYYTKSTMRYETANQPVPAVYYGFYMDQFFAVFIKLRSPDQYIHLERQFSEKYGKPKSTRNTATGLTVHRWKDAKVSIKLKSRKTPVEYKLAMYYLPLAAKLNQDLLESAAPDVEGTPPSANDQSLQPTPLFDY
jgi:hypothetical protein